MPVFEESAATGRLFQELATEFGAELFVVAVDDGSVHQQLEISSLESVGVAGVILKLRRNLGHQKAIALGLSYLVNRLHEEQSVVVMDSDGEDMPQSVHQLLEQLKDMNTDIVVASRKSRVETMRFKIFYAIYKRFFNLMTGRMISFGNFMALKPAAIKRLVAMQELPIHVASAVLASKLRTRLLPLDRGPRYEGKSKMNFVGLVLHGFRGMMVFAEDVLVRVGIASGIIALLTVLGIVAATLLKFLGFATPGWFSIALGIMALIFIQTGALALTTLIMTGLLRSGSPVTSNDYKDYVHEIIATRG
jgi:hypothetical protein